MTITVEWEVKPETKQTKGKKKLSKPIKEEASNVSTLISVEETRGPEGPEALT